MYNLAEKKPVSCGKLEALGGENVVDVIQCFGVQEMKRYERLLLPPTVSAFISEACKTSSLTSCLITRQVTASQT